MLSEAVVKFKRNVSVVVVVDAEFGIRRNITRRASEDGWLDFLALKSTVATLKSLTFYGRDTNLLYRPFVHPSVVRSPVYPPFLGGDFSIRTQ